MFGRESSTFNKNVFFEYFVSAFSTYFSCSSATCFFLQSTALDVVVTPRLVSTESK